MSDDDQFVDPDYRSVMLTYAELLAPVPLTILYVVLTQSLWLYCGVEISAAASWRLLLFYAPLLVCVLAGIAAGAHELLWRRAGWRDPALMIAVLGSELLVFVLALGLTTLSFMRGPGLHCVV